MPSRDVEINLIGHDRTGNATRSAGNNLDQLARKIDKFNGKDIGGTNKVKIKTDVDNQGASRAAGKLKRIFGKAGDDAGNSFGSRLRKKLVRFVNANPIAQSVEHFGRTGGRAGQAYGSLFRSGVRKELTKFVNANPLASTVEHFGRTGARAGRAYARNFRTEMVEGVGAVAFFAHRRLKKSFNLDKDARIGGLRGGGAFFRSFINVVTLGMAGGQLSAGMAKAAPQMVALGATFGGIIAAVMFTEIAQAISAAASLFVGGALLAGPIIFLLAQQAKASKETEKQEKAVAALRKRLSNATNKDTKARIFKQLQGEQRVLDEMHKQSQQWDNIKTKAKSFMTTISAPLKVPLERAIQAMFQGLNNLKGPVREVMTALGTALPGLTAGVFAGLLSFINALKPALPSIVAGLSEWGRVMPQITASVGNLLARLSAHPEAVQGFADSFNTFLGSAGDVIVFMQGVASSYAKLEALIRGGRTRQWGDEWTKTAGKTRIAANAIGQSQLFILRKYDDLLQGIKSVPGSPFDKLKNDTHQARLKMEAEFAAMKASKQKFDRSLSEGSKLAGFKNAINVLKDFKAKVDKALKDPNLSKPRRIKLTLDSHHFSAQLAVQRAKLHQFQKTRSKPKLEADKSRLERTLKQANADLKKTHNKKTIAKIKADKRQAEAALAEVNARLNALDGKTAHASITVTTHYKTTGSSAQAHFLKQSRIRASAEDAWQGNMSAALSGGGTSRTGGPTQVNVAAPTVDTRVFLDSREIRTVARSTVLDENRRATYRARVGRR